MFAEAHPFAVVVDCNTCRGFVREGPGSATAFSACSTSGWRFGLHQNEGSLNGVITPSAFVISTTPVSLFQQSMLQQSQLCTKKPTFTFLKPLTLTVDGHSHQNALLLLHCSHRPPLGCHLCLAWDIWYICSAGFGKER